MRAKNARVVQSSRQKQIGPALESELLSAIKQLGAFGIGATHLKNPYKQYIWSYACIKLIATASSGIPLRFYNSKNELVEDPNDPWLKLFSKPNPLMVGVQFWKIISIYYENFGQVFIVPRDIDYYTATVPGQMPMTLEVVDPRRMEPRVEGGRFIGWRYMRDGGSQQPVENLEINQVIRLFQLDPDDILSGLAPSTPARVSITSDMKAHNYNDKFFENGGQIAGVLMADGKDHEDLEPEEVDEIRANWDSRFSGEQGAHRTPVLTGGLKYTRTGATQKDMDFKDMLILSREEVLAGYGVPKTKVGLTDKVDRAVAKVFDRQFYQDNVMPKLREWQLVINATLLLGTGYRCEFDDSVVEALNADRAESIEGAEKLQDMGYGLNDINEKQNLGMEKVDEKWADKPIDTRAGAQPAQGKSTANADTGDGKGSDKKGAGRSNKSKFRIKSTEVKEDEELSDTALQAKYVSEVLEGANFEDYIKELLRYFRALEKDQIGILAEAKHAPQGIVKQDIETLLFDSDEWDKKLMEDSKKYLETAFADSAEFLSSEIGGFTGFEFTTDPTIKAELERKLIRLTGVNDTIRESVRSALLEGNANNETIQQITERVRHTFDVTRSRALTIARSEIGQSASASRYTAMNAEGLKKRWVTSHDEVVRTTHKEYQSAGVQDMGYDYSGGSNLKHPCDMDCTDASEVINCRCIIRAVKR